jgi:hypothetical protein
VLVLERHDMGREENLENAECVQLSWGSLKQD